MTYVPRHGPAEWARLLSLYDGSAALAERHDRISCAAFRLLCAALRAERHGLPETAARCRATVARIVAALRDPG